MKDEQLNEISAAFSALTLLGIVALWGGKVFYPLWMICAVIHLYQVMSSWDTIDIEDPILLVLLQIVFYTIMSPFYFFMSIYRTILIFAETLCELRKNGRKT